MDRKPRAGIRAMVVDDDASISQLLATMLRELSVEDVTAFTGGREALAAQDAAGAAFDLVLCDLQMPDMDGIEYIRHLAERRFRGSILLISGSDERLLQSVGNLARARDLDVLGVIGKPVRLRAMEEMLGRLWERPALRSADEASHVSAEELGRALEADELTMFFQPQADAVTRLVVGVEALCRWTRPDGSMVPPDVFIPLAEAEGLIDTLTDRVLHMAIGEGGRWHAAGHGVRVAVNVSCKSLNRLDLPERIEMEATRAALPLSSIVLEVTESSLVTHMAETLDILTRLRLKGLGLSIDDFGTGCSTFENLKQIPFTELKVDRSFVNAAPHDPTARSIVESSLSLARTLGMTTVAEGVETDEEWALVTGLGCHTIQGYRFARPMPAPDLHRWLVDHA